jgi:ATP-dependent RNA helicase RhlE
MFSATLSAEVEELIHDFFFDPQKIEIAPHGTPLEKIIQKAYHVPNFNTKLNLLAHLIQSEADMEKVLVFAGTKKVADRLFEQFDKKIPGISGIMHSNKSQNYRFNVLEKFEKGEIKVLIATDIIARGLDIWEVSHVVNFDMPGIAGDYLHRIGRTGRAGKDGTAISLINGAEEPFQTAVEKLMKKSIPLFPVPENVEISNIYSEDEKPDLGNKDYLKPIKRKISGGAYHDKKEKNRKKNSGSPAKKNSGKGQKQNRSKKKN